MSIQSCYIKMDLIINEIFVILMKSWKNNLASFMVSEYRIFKWAGGAVPNPCVDNKDGD